MNKETYKNWAFGIVVSIVIAFGMYFIVNTILNHVIISSNEDKVELCEGDTLTSQGKVLEFEYKNHKFINIIKMDNDGNKDSYVVHDPNCKCTSKKLNNITTVITNTDRENRVKSDSINKENFKVIISKLNDLQSKNVSLNTELKVLKNEVAKLKKPVVAKAVTKAPTKKVVKKVVKKK